MSIKKPYHRNYRGFITDDGYSNWAFIMDRRYAQSPEHYVRAFFLIQDDLKELFEYVEPSEETKATYSYRIHALLMRTCIEIEANFTAILSENTYNGGKFNMTVYKKVNVTHHLSSYQVILPIWNGTEKKFEPFKNWNNDPYSPLPWYQAYNKSKHNRQDLFKEANLENLLDAVSGLLILLNIGYVQL